MFGSVVGLKAKEKDIRRGWILFTLPLYTKTDPLLRVQTFDNKLVFGKYLWLFSIKNVLQIL